VDFTINIPHSLGVKGAAERLDSLDDDLTLKRIVAEKEGRTKGFELSTTTEIDAGNVTVRVRGEPVRFLNFFVPEAAVKEAIETKLRKALG
jgi:hypothetical protein